MAKPIRIIVTGTDNVGDDAPTVEDLLTQIKDQVDILREVEEAIDDSGTEQITWRVTNVTKNSPISIEVTPYPKTHGMNIDRRAAKVISATANGMEQIRTTGARPLYFNDKIIKKVEKINARVTNGLASTTVDFSEYQEAPNFEVNKNTAQNTIPKVRAILQPQSNPHRELGSIEGYITKVELDGFKRPIVWLRMRLDGQVVKCISSDGGLDRIGHYEVAEVLKGLRVLVHGLVNYKDLESVSSIEVEMVDVFDKDSDLPNYDSIVDPDFTGGVESSAYLEALRSDV